MNFFSKLNNFLDDMDVAAPQEEVNDEAEPAEGTTRGSVFLRGGLGFLSQAASVANDAAAVASAAVKATSAALEADPAELSPHDGDPASPGDRHLPSWPPESHEFINFSPREARSTESPAIEEEPPVLPDLSLSEPRAEAKQPPLSEASSNNSSTSWQMEPLDPQSAEHRSSSRTGGSPTTTEQTIGSGSGASEYSRCEEAATRAMVLSTTSVPLEANVDNERLRLEIEELRRRLSATEEARASSELQCQRASEKAQVERERHASKEVAWRNQVSTLDGRTREEVVRQPEQPTESEHLKKQIEEMRNAMVEKDEHLSQLFTLQQEHSILMQSVAALKAEIHTSKLDCKRKDVEVRELWVSLQTSQTETSDKNALLQQCQASLQQAKTKIEQQESLASRATDETISELKSMTSRLADSKASEKALEKQIDDLRKELLKVKRSAREAADKQTEDTLSEVRNEMEEELGNMMKQKDGEIKNLRAELIACEKQCRELARDVEHRDSELKALRAEAESMQNDGAELVGDHRKELDEIVSHHSQRYQALEKQMELESRSRHELAVNLRSVEERSRGEIFRLEAEQAQSAVQLSSLQAQLEEEQQKSTELAAALGEATAEPEPGHVERNAEVAQLTEAALELRNRLNVAEEKLLEAQSMRDMFGKETDMYRGELKVAREERKHLEEELTRQERMRQMAEAPVDPSGAQRAVVESMRKDFEERSERHRDEVMYLRQKCDEKERRCEHLLAEKSSLAVQLRSSDTWTEAKDVESGAVVPQGKSVQRTRGLPLSAPLWLRSADELLRLVIRTLSLSPAARLIFFSYIVLLHGWVLFVLQQAAIQ